MAKPGGRLQAETGRMLRAGLVLFGVAWALLLLFPGHPRGSEGVFYAIPGGIVNVVGLWLLAKAHALAWGEHTEDVRSPGRLRRRFVAGTWSIVIALVLYVVGLVVFALTWMF